MILRDTVEVLRRHRISPSAQRVAIADYVLATTSHPTADEVFSEVRREFPMVSRATVYNALNLFAEKGLLRRYLLNGGRLVFDANVVPHHHFIDDHTGEIHDVAWEQVSVSNVEALEGYDVTEYQVIMRGRRTARNQKP